MTIRDGARHSANRPGSRVAGGLFLLCFLAGMLPARAAASENKVLGVAKDTVYGAASGLLLGGATALIVRQDQRWGAIRWGVALGTFGGFFYGLYDLHRPKEEYSSLDETRPFPCPGEPDPPLRASFGPSTTRTAPDSRRPGAGSVWTGGRAAPATGLLATAVGRFPW